MRRRTGFVLLALVASAALLVIRTAAQQPPSQGPEIELQLADLLFSEGRYFDAFQAFSRAVQSDDYEVARRARPGLIQTSLRIAQFDVARDQAAQLVAGAPGDPEALALYGDALWAEGEFAEAETQYRAALALEPELARGHHGMARSLLARSQLDDAMREAQTALSLSPRDLEIHHTMGSIYERMHRFEEAANAYGNYVNLLPNKDTSDKASWSRAEIRFLRSFGQRIPFENPSDDENAIYTVDFRVSSDKIIVRARVNGSSPQDFVVDTGSENTVVNERTAQRLRIVPITNTLSAGVGEVGLRGLQLARIDTLQVGTMTLRNVPCIIKNPPLRDLPTQEVESFSPLALGYSMVIDYRARKITFGKHLPEEPADFELPLRLYRLATVSGTVDGEHPSSFVIDTGGEVISISQAVAATLDRPEGERRIALQVYGTSGWDRDAFLLPGVNLAFDRIRYDNYSVVVLDLNAPSALLGFKLGGIVGHKFLSQYPRRDRSRTVGAAAQTPLDARLLLQPLRAAHPGVFGGPLLVLAVEEEGRDAHARAGGRHRHEREKRPARELAPPRQGLFREHVHLHLERRGERAGDARFEHDEIADFDRVEELEVVHRGRDHRRARVPDARDRPRDVDQVHNGAAQDVAERVRVVRQHHLHHLGRRLGRPLGGGDRLRSRSQSTPRSAASGTWRCPPGRRRPRPPSPC